MPLAMRVSGAPDERHGDEQAVRRELAARFAAEQPYAIAASLLTFVVVAALLWNALTAGQILLWAGALLTASALAAVAWWRGQSLEAAFVAIGLVWGLCAAAEGSSLDHESLLLLLLALAGLVAGAVAMLAAVPTAFRLFLLAMLGPLPLVLLLHAQDRFSVEVAALTVFFGAGAGILHWRTHSELEKRVRTTALLRRSEADSERQRTFLDKLVAGVPNAIVVIDPNGCFLSVNPGFESLFGYSAAEVIGRPLTELLVPATSLAESSEMHQRVRAGETVIRELERQCKDGRLVTVQVSAAPMVIAGDTLVLFLYTDITEVRKAEAALRATQNRMEQVIASSTAVIYVTRIEGATFLPIWVSGNLKRITGHDVSDALDPAWWIDRLHPDDQPNVFAGLRRLLSDGHLTSEYRFRRKDGEYRWMHDESRLTLDETGKPQEIFGAWLDITDRKLAEDAMRTGRDLAEQAARTQSAFLANMSHEIRTPMNAVLGLTELMLDTELSSYQRRSMGLIRSAGEGLLTLLNDILDFSKIEAEKLTVESIAFDPRYLLEATASLLAVRTEGRPVELAADVAAEVPDFVRGDPTRLRQVLTNLVGNALKFTTAGEVVLSATAEPGPEDAVVIRFSVRDTGIGIAEEQLATIFDEFVQADASMTRRYGGTGLGLAISKRLVALMGGELQVTSEVGRGSEFFFVLTLPVEASRPALIPDSARLTGRRVLVVDDNATNRRIVREILKYAKVTVDEATNAATGFDMLKQAWAEGAPYAVAIIDVQMPDRDGFELAAAVRSDSALGDTRLMMLTSAGQRGDTERCREIGIEGYLTKPVSRVDLLEMAAALLGQPQGSEPATRHSIAESRRRLHILLAEDNPVNQEVAATMLRKRGHKVDLANNGVEAVQAVSRTTYHLVLMDIQMPEMDGFAATRAIRELPGGRELPIIALTAHALTGERERCVANGMDGYISKPFNPHELFSVVEGFGEGRELPEQPAEVADPSIKVDIESFRRSMREAGVEEAVDGILQTFAQQIPQRLAALGAAMDASDSQAISKAAHAFKSPAAAVGAVSLAGVLQEIELAGRDGALDRASAGYGRMKVEIDAVLAKLEALDAVEKHHG